MPRGAWPLAWELSLAPWPRHGVRIVPSANSVAGGVGDHATEPALRRGERSDPAPRVDVHASVVVDHHDVPRARLRDRPQRAVHGGDRPLRNQSNGHGSPRDLAAPRPERQEAEGRPLETQTIERVRNVAGGESQVGLHRGIGAGDRDRRHRSSSWRDGRPRPVIPSRTRPGKNPIGRPSAGERVASGPRFAILYGRLDGSSPADPRETAVNPV